MSDRPAGKKALILGAQDDADAVRATIVADTVRAYADAASTAEQIAIAQRILDLLDRSAPIAQARFERGLNQRAGRLVANARTSAPRPSVT